MARTTASSQAADTAEAVRAAIEEEKPASDLRVAQLEREHHAACLAAYEEYAKFVTEKDEEVALLQRANADLVAVSAKQVASIEQLESSLAQKDAIVKLASDVLVRKEGQIRVQRENARKLNQEAADYAITIQRFSRLQADVAEKDRVIKQLQDSRAQSKRAMQENISRKQDHIEALEDLLAEKEDIEQTTLKLQQAISRKANEIQEWKTYADTLEETVRNRDAKIEKLKTTIEKHERTISGGFPRLHCAFPPSWRQRELLLREKERSRRPSALSLGPTDG